MNVKIFYGGASGFRKILPEDDYKPIVDLAILDDARHRKIKVDMEGNRIEDDEEDVLHFDNVVAFSDDYPSLSESTIESFTNFVLRYDIDNLYLQNPPDSVAKHIQELSCVDCTLDSQDYKVIDMDLLRKIKAGFSEAVIGQENAQKRILAALYNVAKCRYNKPCVMLFYGSTGVGKTMLAKALPSILPDLTEEEELEIAKIYSISGILEKNKKNTIPFRAPHHTITISAMVGGGRIAKAGEVTLANKGVLFLDEVLEYKREVLEALREPLEDGEVHINRIQGSCVLRSDTLVCMAMNMCPCGKGNLEDDYNSDCTCSESEKRRYLNRLSKALMDRIDIFNYIPRIKYEELNKNNSEYTSKKMKERVLKARERQKERLKGTKYIYNSQIKGKDIFELCKINKGVNEILEYYFNNSHPSLRSYGKVITLARTIADLNEKKDIEESHVFEAIGYRKNFKGEII